MPRRPEIGNIQLYPDRPLRESDKNGYVLKFYCPIRGKRIRRNCGTRNKREARRILRECRERLLNGEYVASGGAITVEHEQASTREGVFKTLSAPSESRPWSEVYDDYYRHRKTRGRDSSLGHADSRISIAKRILDTRQVELGLNDDGSIEEYFSLESMEYLQDRLLEGDVSKYDQRAPTTVNTMIGAVMAFARYCHKHGWLDSVPPLEKLSVEETMKGRPVTPDEFQMMLDSTEDVVGERQADSWRRVLNVIWETGFRISEVMEFSWDDRKKIHPIWPENGEHPTLAIPSSQKNKKLQQIPMLPGLAELLRSTPADKRTCWVVNPLPIEYLIRTRPNYTKPTTSDLKRLACKYNNSAIARACKVSETSVRKWLKAAGIDRLSPRTREDIPAEEFAIVRESASKVISHSARRAVKRLSKDQVGRTISRIGQAAGIVVQEEDPQTGKRLKYASAHDLRRGCAKRLINAGVSAETLKIVLRHKDFKTTEKHYGAIREAQAAADEITCKIGDSASQSIDQTRMLPALSASEILKLRALLNSI